MPSTLDKEYDILSGPKADMMMLNGVSGPAYYLYETV